MSDDSNWGTAYMEDGSCVPLVPPPSITPEGEREYLVQRPGLTLWTRRTSGD